MSSFEEDKKLMNSIQVNSLPVLEVIKDLAKAFDTDYKTDACEFTLIIPENWGKGFIKAYQLDNGLGFIEYDCTFFEDLEMQFIVNNTHPLKFIYVINGALDHRFENESTHHSLQEYQSAIIASSNSYGHILNFTANTSLAKFSVEIDRKKFHLNDSYNTKDTDEDLFQLLKDFEAEHTFYYKGDYSLNIADVFTNLKAYDENFEGDKIVYKLYMESIAYQILVLHLTQYLDDQNGNTSQQILRKKEFYQIKNAVEYINEHLENYEGIDELKKVTGLNAIKLQKGFKYLYQCTVNQYVQDCRLEKARDLLVNTDKSINEIVAAIGLSSASYFSRIFKDKYGVQPSLFNKKM